LEVAADVADDATMAADEPPVLLTRVFMLFLLRLRNLRGRGASWPVLPMEEAGDGGRDEDESSLSSAPL
jgi:hypothetical protein